MPCEASIGIERKTAAINALKKRLSEMTAFVVIGKNGSVAFSGWTENDGVSDLCAYRDLLQAQSFELRMWIKKAEVFYGRKIDPLAVEAGLHSHDGGKTWSKH